MQRSPLCRGRRTKLLPALHALESILDHETPPKTGCNALEKRKTINHMLECCQIGGARFPRFEPTPRWGGGGWGTDLTLSLPAQRHRGAGAGERRQSFLLLFGVPLSRIGHRFRIVSVRTITRCAVNSNEDKRSKWMRSSMGRGGQFERRASVK